MRRPYAGLLILVLISAACTTWLLETTSAQTRRRPSSRRATARKAAPQKANPAQAARLNNLGVAYMNQQAFEKAAQYFQQASTANPSALEPRLNQGIALLNMQKVQQAEPILEEATKREPNNARAWYNLGLLYKGSGDFTNALAAFKRAGQLAPKDADAFYFLGLSYSQTGDNQAAADAFKRALELSPFHASAEFGLARAYQKLSEPDEAKLHLARFQHLTQTKIGSPITLAYGEQGPLSLVATIGQNAQEAEAAIPVKFAGATTTYGLNPSIAGAACILDFDSDNRPDVFFTGGTHSAALFRNIGNGKFEDVTKNSGIPDQPALACSAADYDNDGKPDLAVAYPGDIALYHNDGATFTDSTRKSGLQSKSTSHGLLWVDSDHDGDADLFVTSESGTEMWRNNGNGTFSDATAETALSANGATTSAIATDANNDRAVDIIALPKSGAPVLSTNPREGKWPSSTPWPDSVSNATSITTLDFNKDGWMDLAFAANSGLVLLRNVEGQKFELVDLPATNWQSASSVLAFDYDNDGFIDLLASGTPDGKNYQLKLFRNLGGRFEDMTSKVGLDPLSFDGPATLASADLDEDGDTDILLATSTTTALLSNDGGNKNRSLRISLKGLADNKSALGTKAEVFASDLWQKWEVHSGGGPGQSSTEILAGLGKRTEVDVVRLLWPTGVIQDEIELPITKPAHIIEIDRRGSSCPVLFAWNGRKFQFISDMIGAGVVGHWVGPNQRNVPDPTEYLKVEGASVRPRRGLLHFRFMEPMEEVVYLDQVRLLAVDHPPNVEVNPNEYFAGNPPFPPFKVISSRRDSLHVPAGAWDDRGRDVLSHLTKSDHDYVTGFRLLNYSGYTDPHYLELDLGEPYRGGTLRLVMRGFIEYFTATSMYAAHQAGIDPVAPYVEALNGDGKWTRVVDDMGFPAGLPRTIVADLTRKLPIGTRRVRIATNLQIYWDQVLIDTTAALSMARVEEVPLASARLIYHGYPRDVERRVNAPGDHYYVYEDVSRTGPYSRQQGAYTRVGAVDGLLRQVDDRFVVFGSGDAINLEFDPASLAALPEGWVRDYFFFAHGYEKDMDFYAAGGLTVEPLPFGDMKSYPYAAPESFLRDEGSVNYLLNTNTRFYSGNPAGLKSSYRFER